MLRHTLPVVVMLAALPASAAADPSELRALRHSVVGLAEELRLEASRCEDRETLLAMRDALQSARERRRGHLQRRAARREAACIELALSVHGELFSSGYALQRARQDCAEPLDLRVARLALAAHRQSFSAGYAWDRAKADARRADLRGRDLCLEQAQRVHRTSHSASYAWHRAVQDCARR